MPALDGKYQPVAVPRRDAYPGGWRGSDRRKLPRLGNTPARRTAPGADKHPSWPQPHPRTRQPPPDQTAARVKPAARDHGAELNGAAAGTLPSGIPRSTNPFTCKGPSLTNLIGDVTNHRKTSAPGKGNCGRGSRAEEPSRSNCGKEQARELLILLPAKRNSSAEGRCLSGRGQPAPAADEPLRTSRTRRESPRRRTDAEEQGTPERLPSGPECTTTTRLPRPASPAGDQESLSDEKPRPCRSGTGAPGRGREKTRPGGPPLGDALCRTLGADQPPQPLIHQGPPLRGLTPTASLYTCRKHASKQR